MARINVEDDLLRNPRFQALVRHLDGDLDRALGRLVRFWWVAQEHWGRDENLVPHDEFRIGDFGGLAEVGLADPREGGVYARGAKEHFDWYRQRIEAASKGGKKSAAARRKAGSAVPKNARNAPKQTEANTEAKASKTEAKPNPLTLTLHTETETEELRPLEGEPKAGDVWKAYEAVYFAKYRTPPVRNARSMGMCAQLVKRLGGDAAVGVVRFYVNHQNAYYVQKLHALGPCLVDCEGLHTQMRSGMQVTRASASHADKQGANAQAFANVAAKFAARAKLKEGEGDGGAE